MAFYSLVHTGVIYEQQWQNQYNYQSSSIGSVVDGAEELVGLFITDVVPFIRSVQRLDAAVFLLKSVYAVDIYDDSDFFEFINPPGATGTRGGAGPAMSPFVSFSFRTERWRVGRNRGYKRYAGICEDDVSGNVYDPGGTFVDDIAAALSTNLIGGTDQYFPTIAGKEVYVPDPEFPLKTAYRYYPTEAEQRAESSGVVSWLGYRLTTQRSRIAGQGA